MMAGGASPRTPLSPSTSWNLKSVYRSPLTPDSGSGVDGEHDTSKTRLIICEKCHGIYE